MNKAETGLRSSTSWRRWRALGLCRPYGVFRDGGPVPEQKQADLDDR